MKLLFIYVMLLGKVDKEDEDEIERLIMYVRCLNDMTRSFTMQGEASPSVLPHYHVKSFPFCFHLPIFFGVAFAQSE